MVFQQYTLDRVSVLPPIAIDILMVQNGERQSSYLLFVCVNMERQISVILSYFTCSLKILPGETNYNINVFSKRFRHYSSIHL